MVRELEQGAVSPGNQLLHLEDVLTDQGNNMWYV